MPPTQNQTHLLFKRHLVIGLVIGLLLFISFAVFYHYPSLNPLQKGFDVDVSSADNPSEFIVQTTGNNGRMNSKTHVGLKQNNVHVFFKAWLRTDIAGDYGFALQGKDSAVLRISGLDVIHASGMQKRTGQHYLFAGFHEIVIEYRNRHQPGFIDLKWTPPDSERYRPVPVSLLYTDYPDSNDLKAENRFYVQYMLLIWGCIVLSALILTMHLKNNSRHHLKFVLRTAISFFVFLFLMHTPFLGYDHQSGFLWLINMETPFRVLVTLLIFGLLSGWLKPLFKWFEKLVSKRPRLRWCIGFSAVVCGIAGQYFFMVKKPTGSYFLPVFLYSVSAVIIMLAGFRPESIKKPAVTTLKHRNKLFLLATGLALFWACWVRFYRINEIPPGFWWDEAQTGRIVRHILEGDYPPIYDLRINAGTVASYANAVWCYVLGSTDPWALRTWAGFVGVLTVAASWWFFRQLFTAWWSLFGMAILAGSRWLFSINRIAMAMIDETILVAVLILTFYIRAMRRNRMVDYIVTGLLVGLSMHLHTGARVLPLVIGFDMIVRLLQTGSLTWKRRLRNALTLILFASAVFAPMAMYIFENFDNYMKRSRETLLSGEYPGWYPFKPYLLNAGYYLEMYVYRGDWHPRHNYARKPQLATAASVLTAIGLFLSLRSLKKHPVHRLLFLMFILTSAQGIATVHLDSANLNRVAVNIPVIATWAVFGAIFVCRGLGTLFKKSYRQVIPFGVMTLVMGSIWYQEYKTYFYDYPRWRQLAELYGFQVDVNTIAHLARELIDTDPNVRVWAMYAGGDPFHYVFSGHERLGILSANRVPNIDSRYPAVLLLPAHERRTLRMLERAFPNADSTIIPYSLNPSIPLVIKMTVEPGNITTGNAMYEE